MEKRCGDGADYSIIIIIIIRNAKIIVTLSRERYRGTLQSIAVQYSRD